MYPRSMPFTFCWIKELKYDDGHKKRDQQVWSVRRDEAFGRGEGSKSTIGFENSCTASKQGPERGHAGSTVAGASLLRAKMCSDWAGGALDGGDGGRLSGQETEGWAAAGWKQDARMVKYPPQNPTFFFKRPTSRSKRVKYSKSPNRCRLNKKRGLRKFYLNLRTGSRL